MSIGTVTFDATGQLISRFEGEYLRLVARVRVEALETGSLQLDIPASKARFFFQADEPVLMTAPVISISPSGLLSWRPYATSPAVHTGGYILIGISS